jgi:DNA-binding NarL/FixJ family response regulator
MEKLISIMTSITKQKLVSPLINNSKIKVAIIDDHLLFREGLKELIEKYEEIEVKISTGDIIILFEHLKNCFLDVILLDISMPNHNGLEILNKIKLKSVQTKILMLSQYYDDQTIVYAMKKGANGFLSKTVHYKIIISAIKETHRNGFYLDNKISNLLARNFSDKEISFPKHLSSITDREKEILILVCEERSNNEIAEKLFISIRTVETHIENLYKKTNAKTRTGLVFFALRKNLYQIN